MSSSKTSTSATVVAAAAASTAAATAAVNLTQQQQQQQLLLLQQQHQQQQQQHQQQLQQQPNMTPEQQMKFQQQLLQLKQQQQLQQQLLLQHFQQQQQQLAEQHEKQLQDRIRDYLEAQKKHEDELKERALKEKIEKEKLDALKKKDKHEHSAIASSEVKQRLQEFVLNKKHREAKAAAAAAAAASNPLSMSQINYNNCSNSNGSPPATSVNWNPLLAKYEDELVPLRKTASEPNLKIRSALKQKVLERRSSPLLRRKLAKLRGRPPALASCSNVSTSSRHYTSISGLSGSSGASSSAPVSASSSIESNTPPNSKPESTPGSPPVATGHLIHPLAGANFGSSTGSTPILELYSSPSLPNISLGRPHAPTITGCQSAHNGTYISGENALTEAQLKLAAATATTAARVLPSSMSVSTSFSSTLPFCPSLPVIEGEFSPPSSPTYLQQQLKTALEQQNPSKTINEPLDNNTQNVDYQNNKHEIRLQNGRTIHRPLSRTQSAPLPLGHPLLQSPTSNSLPKTIAQSEVATSRAQQQQHQRNLLKQHIRQTVLTRASSKQQLQNQSFEEETEAAIALEMKDSLPSTPSRKEKIKRQYSQEGDHVFDTKIVDLRKVTEKSNSVDETFNRSSVIDDDEIIEINSDTNQINRIKDLDDHHRLKTREAFLEEQRDLIENLPTSSNPSITANPIDLSIYHQVLYQQQAALHQQISSGSPLAQALSLVPEVNQYPQVIPFSRYSFYHQMRPLSRASSSPLVALISPNPEQGSLSPPIPLTSSRQHTFTTGLAYDSLMLKHQCICGDNSHHPEHGGRLQSIWARLQETGLALRCERIRSRKANLDELQLCHSEAYTLLFGTSPLNRQKLDPNKLSDLPIKSFVMLQCGGIGVDSDTTWNELHTASAARMAAGCVIDLSLRVATNELKNGFAIVRPPGHHAEHQQAMGFSFFNSISVAAQQVRKRLNFERILIVDWDVHHGNGTQQIFYDDPHVLYISLHRHDDGNFFPGTGDPFEVGAEDGVGFNVNIAWSGSLTYPISDAEYLAAFRSLVIPIARDFQPELVLVSCGFDAAAGHPPPLGGYQVSPACFGWMTKQLIGLANGKIVLALEGGFDLPSICDCSQECVMALLEEKTTSISEEEKRRKPHPKAIETLRKIINIQAPHWPIVKRYAHLIDCSNIEAQQKEREEFEAVSALASLTMQHIKSPENLTKTEEPMDQDDNK